MTQSIPASQLVNVIPSVLSPGGNPLSLNAVFLTEDTSIPFGVAQAFANAASVASWFGPNSQEAIDAANYFAGYSTASVLPSTLYFFQYNPNAVAAYLRSANLSAVSLAALQALSGTITIVIDGMTVVSAAINLSGATSYSNAAALIQTGLQTPGGIFQGTATLVNASPTMTVVSTVSGHLYLGMPVSGTDIPPGTIVQAFGTYTVGAGTGTVTLSANASATVSSPEAVTGQTGALVTYDSLRKAFVITSATTGATSSVAFPTSNGLTSGLLLTSNTGAVQSAGAAAATPTTALNAVVAATQNWSTLHLVFDPDAGAAGGAIKLEFAQWISQNSPAGQERFVYVAWDVDQTPASNGSDGASFAAALIAAAYNGTIPIYEGPDPLAATVASNGRVASFWAGMIASTNYNANDGAIAYDGKGQAGLAANVASGTTSLNLLANGYNFYGAYGTANQQFLELQPGSMPGQWVWADSYVNQIWLNSNFQLALMIYKQQSNKVPYNTRGTTGIRGAMLPTINQGLANGVIQAGVALSASQALAINSATNNLNSATTLENVGWLLFIGTLSPTLRNTRVSPPITFYYTDGGSIRTINLNSVDVE
jgi:hypothetical protein